MGGVNASLCKKVKKPEIVMVSLQMHEKGIVAQLREAGLSAELDESGDQISAQIRRAQVDKIPWMLVVGKQEQEQGTVTLRHNDGKQEFGLTLDALISRAQELNRFE